MPYITAFNTTDGPVLIDDEGRTVAGGTWGPVLSSQELAKAALADGRLVKVDRPKGDADLDPDARAVFDTVDELEAARATGDARTEAAAAEDASATPTGRARRAPATDTDK